MAYYEISYYPLDVDGKRIGSSQLGSSEGSNEEEARVNFIDRFNSILEIEVQLHPGVKSIEIDSVEMLLDKSIKEYFSRERELDDIKLKGMSNDEKEKYLRDFISGKDS